LCHRAPVKTRFTQNDETFSMGRCLKAIAFKAVLVFLLLTVVPVVLLRWLPPLTTAFMIYRHVEDLRAGQGYHAIEYRWISHEKISAYAYKAVVASEDQRFFRHLGFDFNAIQASIDNYQDGGKLRGASTISQQVAKNLFLIPAKSFLRKGLEVWFTVLIELFWSKQRILEMYLNIAEFGDHLFGVEAASRRYFSVPASRLGASQAALLAATLPNPILLKARQPSAYVLKRQQWILRQMRNYPF